MHIHTSDQEKFDIGFGNYTCNWGLHMAGLYETEEERDEILFGFLKKGCEDNDLQLYCPAERTPEDFKQKYSHYCPHCGEYLENENLLSLFSVEDLYYPNGKFSPWDMDKGLSNFYKKTQENGKRNVRATVEMVWALEKIPGVEDLMAYESRLNYFIPGKPWISICMYNVTKFSGDVIMNVLRTHPYTINGGVISQNPFYMDPDEWLAKNAPQYLNK